MKKILLILSLGLVFTATNVYAETENKATTNEVTIDGEVYVKQEKPKGEETFDKPIVVSDKELGTIDTVKELESVVLRMGRVKLQDLYNKTLIEYDSNTHVEGQQKLEVIHNELEKSDTVRFSTVYTTFEKIYMIGLCLFMVTIAVGVLIFSFLNR